MARLLRNLLMIRMKADITPYANIGKSDFGNYFRTFKKPEEYVEDNHFYSPFFSRGDVLSMHEHYGFRHDAMETIANALTGKVVTSVYLAYDFRFVAGGTEYCTDGEFQNTKRIISRALRGTGLYLFFMVSHFGQLAGKNLEEKTEHYHLLLCKDREMDEIEYDVALNQFADNLRCDWIEVQINE